MDYSFICTRSEKLNDTTKYLVDYLEDIGFEVNLLVNKPSIFSAYSEAFDLIPNKKPHTKILMCHDDIEILSDKNCVKSYLFGNTIGDRAKPVNGFIGVAGCKTFTESCVWWDKTIWTSGRLSGTVFHGKNKESMQPTYFGPFGDVVALDGLFLFTDIGTLSKLKLNKPETFKGDWDFYDIYYTLQAHKLGMKNRTVPILLRHESIGELAGRTSWELNRKAMSDLLKDKLPISV